MRSTGMNKVTRGGKLETYGRTPEGEKTKIRTSGSGSSRRQDTYWGGKGKPDGPGHGHEARESGFSRKPSR
jgi:1,6-anhydro-N-acetylmuramate kinase